MIWYVVCRCYCFWESRWTFCWSGLVISNHFGARGRDREICFLTTDLRFSCFSLQHTQAIDTTGWWVPFVSCELPQALGEAFFKRNENGLSRMVSVGLPEMDRGICYSHARVFWLKVLVLTRLRLSVLWLLLRSMVHTITIPVSVSALSINQTRLCKEIYCHNHNPRSLTLEGTGLVMLFRS